MAKRRPRKSYDRSTTYYKDASAIRRKFTKLYNYKTYNRLLKQYKKYAKVADQRLVELEKAAKLPGYENILSYIHNKKNPFS